MPSATLRAWERRYGLVTPVRTESGYRLYDERGLQLLRAMAALVAGGWSPRQAAEHLRREGDVATPESWDGPGGDPTDATRPAGGESDAVAGGESDAVAGAESDAVAGGESDAVAGSESDAVAGSESDAVAGGESDVEHGARSDQGEPAVGGAWDVTALARGAAELDPADVERAVDAAFAAGSFEQVVDSWLMPALAMLGAQWREGRVDVAGEHVVSAIVHRRLGIEMEAASRAPHGPRVVVGLARGSHHELGILAFSVVLRRAGVEVVYLGADLPAQHWVRAVQQRQPAAVVIGVPTAHDILAARETVATLRGANPQVVHVGGGAQFEVGQGTVPLGHEVAAAALGLAATLRTPQAG